MQIKKLVIALLCGVSMIAFLYGCGTANKESAIAAADVAKVGDTVCFQCHSATADPLTGDTIVIQYQRSLHAELGCESCHGGGAQHNGIGPLPFPKPDAARCAQCHDGVTQVTTISGAVVTAPLSSSPNFQNGNHANPFSAEEAHEAKCARCHSHEGSILYGNAGYTGDRTILDNTTLQPVLARDPETFNTIRCATCHEHGANLRQVKTRAADANRTVVTWDPNRNGVTDQYDLCTSCHNMRTNEGMLFGSGDGKTPAGKGFFALATNAAGTTFKNISTAPFDHNTRWFRTLPSTHYDQPASPFGTVIEGYVIRNLDGANATESTKNPCYDCHGHEFKANTRALVDHPERPTTILTDWALSGHAGKLLSQKLAAAATQTNSTKAQVDAVMKAGVTSTSGDGWLHYDWDLTRAVNTATTDSNDRGSCQACHTSTGFANYANDPTTYNPDNNDFKHLSGWKAATATAKTTSSGQNELLYCWGCHTNSGTGKLRSTGSATLTFKVNDQPVVINNVGNSAACVVCHGGRGSASEAIATDAPRSTRFAGHHAPTAAVVFAAQTHLAFEYAGQNYINPAFQHDKINAGTDGPCASCHMANKKHTFASISSSGGVVQKINAQTLCNSCHGTMPTTTLDDDKAGYAQASTILNNFVNNVAGFPNYLGAKISTAAADAALPNFYLNVEDNAYGAFQNGKLNGDEPCAYVHNPTYARRIVFDSIDWMDNGALNGTITIDATAFPKAAAWFGVPAGGTVSRP